MNLKKPTVLSLRIQLIYICILTSVTGLIESTADTRQLTMKSKLCVTKITRDLRDIPLIFSSLERNVTKWVHSMNVVLDTGSALLTGVSGSKRMTNASLMGTATQGSIVTISSKYVNLSKKRLHLAQKHTNVADLADVFLVTNSI